MDTQKRLSVPLVLLGSPVWIVSGNENKTLFVVRDVSGRFKLPNQKEKAMTRYSHMTHGTLKTGQGLREYYIGIQNDEVAMPIAEAKALANDILRNVADAERENKRDLAAAKKEAAAAQKKVRPRKKSR